MTVIIFYFTLFYFIIYVLIYCLFVFLGPHLWHRGPIRAVAAGLCQSHSNAPDPSHVCDLYHSSWQHWIPNPLSKARDGTCNLSVPSQIRFRCATTGTPSHHMLEVCAQKSFLTEVHE